MKRRLTALLLTIIAVLSIPAYAFAAAPGIKKTEYEGAGYVEVDFTAKVRYKNVKVFVKGPDGKEKAAVVTEKDGDDLTFRITDAKPGKKYTYTISGVRVGKSGAFQSVTGSFRVPKWDPLIKEIDYDAKDRELEIEFIKRVQYKNLKVIITDANGKNLRCGVDERTAKDIDLYVKGMKKGEKYHISLSGIRTAGQKSYGTISGMFVA